MVVVGHSFAANQLGEGIHGGVLVKGDFFLGDRGLGLGAEAELQTAAFCVPFIKPPPNTYPSLS